jgi:type I restriction enzyme S subunit
MKQKEKTSLKQMVPDLRFPEFADAGDWAERDLEEISAPITERANETQIHNILSLTSESGLVLQSDYFGKKIAGSDVSRYIQIREFDFVYNDRTTKSYPYGALKRLENIEHGIVSPIYKCFRFSRNENSSFWSQYFEARLHEIEIKKLVNEGARAGRFNISISQFLGISVNVPSLPEQQKIADCLSSLDEVISLESQKLQSLQSYKKGLLQNLFPAEGETVPKLRFPEFEGTVDWEEVGGDFLFDPITNKNHDSSLPILAITQEHGAIPRHLIDYQISVTEKSIESYKVVEPGDFIISLRSFQGGIEYSNYLGICSPAYIILRKNRDLSNHFYRYYFKTTKYIQDLNKNIEGIRDGKMVSFKQFSEIQIPFPSLLEQQKIADCLSSIDALIQEQLERVESLKSHKKGLLQGLFPVMGE